MTSNTYFRGVIQGKKRNVILRLGSYGWGVHRTLQKFCLTETKLADRVKLDPEESIAIATYGSLVPRACSSQKVKGPGSEAGWARKPVSTTQSVGYSPCTTISGLASIECRLFNGSISPTAMNFWQSKVNMIRNEHEDHQTATSCSCEGRGRRGLGREGGPLTSDTSRCSPQSFSVGLLSY